MMKFKTVFESKVLGSKEVEHLVTLVTNEEDGKLKIKYHKDMWVCSLPLSFAIEADYLLQNEKDCSSSTCRVDQS